MFAQNFIKFYVSVITNNFKFMGGKVRSRLNRRRFLLSCALTGGGIVAADLLSKSGHAQVSAPAIVTSDKMRPQLPFGVASGDITGNGSALSASP
jgi:alkaline phosphatase D